jgi:hypothetical protein
MNINKATAGSTPTAINEQESPIGERKAQYNELNIMYCQPTSSKIKVEDLVMDKPEGKEQVINASPRPFWDRPIPKLHFEWTYDPHMPQNGMRWWHQCMRTKGAVSGIPKKHTDEQHQRCWNHRTLRTYGNLTHQRVTNCGNNRQFD